MIVHKYRTDQSSEKPRILFLRSTSQARHTAFIAEGLKYSTLIEFEQYPPVGPTMWKNLDQMYDPVSAHEALSWHVVESRSELRTKIENGYYDLVLLFDFDGQLFFFQQLGAWRKIRNWIGKFKPTFDSRPRDISLQIQYMYGSPISIKEMVKRVPVAAVDLDDWTSLSPPSQKILNEVSFYFKREIPCNRFHLYSIERPSPWSVWRKKLIPVFAKVNNIPLGIEDKKYHILKSKRNGQVKDIDILYCSSDTSTIRLKVQSLLERLVRETAWNIVIKSSMPFEEYCETIARSKVVLSISGGGWDCYRHYEVVALGSLPLMDRPVVEATWWQALPQELFFEVSFDNLRTKLVKFLSDEELIGEAFTQLEQHVEDHMLHSKIVEHMVFFSLDNTASHLS